MSETGQVLSQALPECRPRSVRGVHLCCLLPIRRRELLTRHVRKLSGQFWLATYPLCQVIERFLSLHGYAVKAQHKGQSSGSLAPLKEPVVHLGKECFTHICCWQDATLHREIVLSRFISDSAYSTQQACR